MPERTRSASGASSRAKREPGPIRALLVALTVCTVCSLLVSASAVLLRPRQRANRERERQAAVRALVEDQPELGELLADVEGGEVREWVIELASGEHATWIDPARFDAERAAHDPLSSVALPAERDLAGIGRRAHHATAYVVTRGDRPVLVVLPVRGQGYGGLMHGHVALAGDGNTVLGLSFHEHEETPGVGGSLLEDEDWLGEWRGKRVRDAEGRVRIGVAEQELDPDSEEAEYRIDAVSGATKTCGGVGNLLRFWLGEEGFGPFLERVGAGGAIR